MPVIYMVYKKGIYGHGVHACSLDSNVAKGMADDLAKRDRDSHHSWEVYEVPLEELSPEVDNEGYRDQGFMAEGKALYSAQKD